MRSTADHIILYLKANKIFNTKGPSVLLEALLGFPLQPGTFATARCCATTGNLDRFIYFSSLTKHPLNPLLLRTSDSAFRISILPLKPLAWKAAGSVLFAH